MPDNSIYQSSSETDNTWKDLISGEERGIYDEVAARLTRFGLASQIGRAHV